MCWNGNTWGKLKTGFIGEKRTGIEAMSVDKTLRSHDSPERCVGLSRGGQTHPGKIRGEGICAFSAPHNFGERSTGNSR